MSLQSEYTTEIECLRHYPKSLCIRDGETHISPNFISFNQRTNTQNPDSQNNHNKDQLYCDRVKTNQCITPPNEQMCTLNEQRNPSMRSSFESICSRYLLKETKYSSSATNNSKIETKTNFRKHVSKQNYGVNTKVTFTNSHDQASEKLYESEQEKTCSDKTTYCRPVTNFYNQELLYKTMVKNAKLRRLVTELASARQKEKEMENWNNYINNLRRKHNADSKVKLATSLQYISDFGTLDNIEDIYNTKYPVKHSNHCQSLLQDLYNPHNTITHKTIPIIYNDFNISPEPSRVETSTSYIPFKTNRLCFPTSSHGRLIMLERERMKRLTNRGYKPLFKTINEEKKLESEGLKRISNKELVCGPKMTCVACNSRSTNTALQCASTQTEFQKISSKSVNGRISKGCNTNHVVDEKECSKDVPIKEAAVETCYCPDTNLRNSSLDCIEEKLDHLIHSINNFITEMQTKCVQHKNFHVYTKLGKRNVNYTRSDMCNIARKEKIVCGLVDDSCGTTRNSSMETMNRIQTIDENLTKINDILSKGIGQKQFVTLKRSSVEETYPCSVQISVTIPTREISTEVTRSLSEAAYLKHRNIIIEEIPKSGDSKTAIAVNTDPLSLLAMLRESTEVTIRRLMSYVPTIDYYSYLSRLQGPSQGIGKSQFVCNICGAAFTKPSALTDHIQKHELGITRDCCVCRHVLDLPRRRPSLFKCQYCGQRFTRAYCCELHQESCAKRMGKLHDVPSSLVLLK